MLHIKTYEKSNSHLSPRAGRPYPGFGEFVCLLRYNFNKKGDSLSPAYAANSEQETFVVCYLVSQFFPKDFGLYTAPFEKNTLSPSRGRESNRDQ
jgi:hypothetical protein